MEIMSTHMKQVHGESDSMRLERLENTIEKSLNNSFLEIIDEKDTASLVADEEQDDEFEDFKI